jgi:hypothetical protein
MCPDPQWIAPQSPQRETACPWQQTHLLPTPTQCGTCERLLARDLPVLENEMNRWVKAQRFISERGWFGLPGWRGVGVRFAPVASTYMVEHRFDCVKRTTNIAHRHVAHNAVRQQGTTRRRLILSAPGPLSAPPGKRRVAGRIEPIPAPTFGNRCSNACHGTALDPVDSPQSQLYYLAYKWSRQLNHWTPSHLSVASAERQRRIAFIGK